MSGSDRAGTEFGPGEARGTPPGQARYVGENVLHRGHNLGAGSVQVLSINMTQRGKWFRVEASLPLPKAP